jgi:hypothetical protein
MFDTFPGFLGFLAVLGGLLAGFCLRSRNWKVSCGTGFAVFALLFMVSRGMGGILAPLIVTFFGWPLAVVCLLIAVVQMVRAVRRRRSLPALTRPKGG